MRGERGDGGGRAGGVGATVPLVVGNGSCQQPSAILIVHYYINK